MVAQTVVVARNDAGQLIDVKLERHLLTVAAAGWGKGMLLATNLLGGFKGSCFVFDPKGELCWLTSHYRAKPVSEGGLGQRVVILDPFDQVNTRFHAKLGEVAPKLQIKFPPVRPVSWNPLSGVDELKDESTFVQRITDLGEGLVRSANRDKHWDDSAKMLLRGLCAAAVEVGDHGDKAPISDVWAWLKMPAREWADRLLGKADDDGRRPRPGALNRDRYAYQALNRFGDQTREVSSIVSNALTQTSFLEDKRMLRVFEDPASSDRFTFGDLVRQPMTVYVVLPPHLFNDHYGRWLRLLLQRALNEVMAGTGTEKVLFLLDEFGTIGELPSVATAFGLSRYKLALWPFVQDLNQLQRDYRATWQTFIANCSAQTYFGINDMTTAEHVSREWGDVEAQKASFALAGGGGSMSQQWERYTRPEKVVKLTQADGKVLLRRQGDFAVCDPVPYYEIDTFAKRARPDPYQPTTLALHQA